MKKMVAALIFAGSLLASTAFAAVPEQLNKDKKLVLEILIDLHKRLETNTEGYLKKLKALKMETDEGKDFLIITIENVKKTKTLHYEDVSRLKKELEALKKAKK